MVARQNPFAKSAPKHAPRTSEWDNQPRSVAHPSAVCDQIARCLGFALSPLRPRCAWSTTPYRAFVAGFSGDTELALRTPLRYQRTSADNAIASDRANNAGERSPATGTKCARGSWFWSRTPKPTPPTNAELRESLHESWRAARALVGREPHSVATKRDSAAPHEVDVHQPRASLPALPDSMREPVVRPSSKPFASRSTERRTRGRRPSEAAATSTPGRRREPSTRRARWAAPCDRATTDRARVTPRDRALVRRQTAASLQIHSRILGGSED